MHVVRNEPADILPRVPILMAFAAEFIDSCYGEFASDYRVLVEANLRCIERFDFDQVSAISDPFRETQGFGAEITFPRDSVPRCTAPPLAETQDLAALKDPDPHNSERMLDRVRAVEEFRRLVAGQYSILGWVEGPAAEAADLRGAEAFLLDLALDASFACELMDRCVEVGVDFARAQVEAGADTIGVGDALASQMSAAMYEQFVFPREQQLCQGIHDAGGLVRLHICGDTTHLLPWFGKLGADLVDLDWQVDMVQARREIGDHVVLAGNLDPVNAVQKNTPDAIRQGIERIYETVGNPYMAGAGCEIPPGTAPEKLKALCSAIPWA
jgi:MtaA/CmuA family methyltransferase